MSYKESWAEDKQKLQQKLGDPKKIGSREK